jgi:sec-independent protein translocase protein TatA
MMWVPGVWEISIIGLVAVLMFGSKLPSIARNFGKAIPSFKRGITEGQKEVVEIQKEIEDLSKDMKKNAE